MRRDVVEQWCFLPKLTEAQWAWTIFDAGSFGFYTATYNTIVPMWLYNSATWYGGLTPAEATAEWSYAVTFTTILTSALSPLTGWIADRYSMRRAATVLFSVLSPLFLLTAATIENNMKLRILLVSFGYSAYNLHFTFFFSLLPSVVCAQNKDERSCRGNKNDDDNHRKSTIASRRRRTPQNGKSHELSILSTALSNIGAGMLLLGVLVFDRYAQGSGLTPITTQQGHLNTLVLFSLCAAWWWVIAMPLALAGIEEPSPVVVETARIEDDKNTSGERESLLGVSIGSSNTTGAIAPDCPPGIRNTAALEDIPSIPNVLSNQDKETGTSCCAGVRKRKNMWIFLAGNYFVNEGSSVIYQMIALYALATLHLTKGSIL
eukprot:g5261.t1